MLISNSKPKLGERALSKLLKKNGVSWDTGFKNKNIFMSFINSKVNIQGSTI